MTETILIIILSVIAIILAAGFVKQFLNDHKEKLHSVLTDTGYEKNHKTLQVWAKVVDLYDEPDPNRYIKSPYMEYEGVVFELEDGSRLDFIVPVTSSFAMNIGVTGVLYYLEPDRFCKFVPDKAIENRKKMFP
ncbi:MAG: hypothetical protein IKD30_00920 [Peptococcaceae bacterium]|nr:hypothetical protein [Peptococcaceae bacterium]